MVHLVRLRHGQPGVLRAVGAEGRRVVPREGVLLRLEARAAPDDGRGV